MQRRHKNREERERAEVRPDEQTEFKVKDRRHWIQEEEDDGERSEAEAEPRKPTLIDEYRERAEGAERKLQEYIDAFKTFKEEQEMVRVRLNRDVDRKVELKFGELVSMLLESVDNLDLALAHSKGVPEAEPLAEGVELARNSFLATLEQHGIEKIAPDGEAFDPNLAEALRMDPVDSPELDGTVTETLRPGYRLGECLIRPARVAVGRHARAES